MRHGEPRTVPFQLNGRNLLAEITVDVSDEQEPVDVAYETEEENREYIARFDSDELANVCITVTARHVGSNVKASDSLGACHVRTRYFEEDVEETIESHGMVAEALSALEADMWALRASLADAFGATGRGIA